MVVLLARELFCASQALALSHLTPLVTACLCSPLRLSQQSRQVLGCPLRALSLAVDSLVAGRGEVGWGGLAVLDGDLVAAQNSHLLQQL